MPDSASTSRFSSPTVNNKGAAAGFTTSSGWGSNVTSTLRSPSDEARDANLSSTSRWPRCTPSKVPTATTVASASGGSPDSGASSARSGIRKDHPWLPHCVDAIRDGDQPSGVVDQGRPGGDGRGRGQIHRDGAAVPNVDHVRRRESYLEQVCHRVERGPRHRLSIVERLQ